jgi:DNA-binding CsgD family transcriptional regulator
LLFEFNPRPLDDGLSGPLPAFLAPLSRAARENRPLEQPLLDIIGPMGFTGVDYGFTTARTLDRDSRGYRWTTLPKQWLAEYDHFSYIEIDPRVADRWTNPTPIIWDRRIAWGRTEVETFLQHAATYGIGSGAAVFFRDEHFSRTVFALHSPRRELDDRQAECWVKAIPAMLMLAFEFHAIFRRQFVARGIAPLQQGAQLSPRELQCLRMASHGLTSNDIARKLGLAERTVNFHFCNIVTKLAAVNRAEAIATAVALGLISSRG